MFVKKYTEDHEWIELDDAGKIGTDSYGLPSIAMDYNKLGVLHKANTHPLQAQSASHPTQQTN